jgi:hypothetical protein
VLLFYAAIRELGEFGASKTTPAAKALINNPYKTAGGSIGAALVGQGMQDPGNLATDMSQVTPEIKSIEERLIYEEKPEYKPDPKKKVTENLKNYKEQVKNFKPKPIGIMDPSSPEEMIYLKQIKLYQLQKNLD